MQNKVIKTALDGKQDKLTFDTTPTASSTNPVTSGGVKTELDKKQDKLTFDTAPKSGSTNPVTSDGVKAEIDKKQDKLTFDTTPTKSSTNPVTSGGVKDALPEALTAAQMQQVKDAFTPNTGAPLRMMKYSTDEQVIGEWIDGKPLYQKTIDLGFMDNTPASASVQVIKSIDCASLNIDTVVHCYGIQWNSANDNCNPLPILDDKGFIRLFIEGKQNLQLRGTSTMSTTQKVFATILYTKTTD